MKDLGAQNDPDHELDLSLNLNQDKLPETEKLYYQDSFLKEFTAHVLYCERQSAHMDLWRVVLDRTAFYPEGGGQPADHGVLDIAAVTDVQENRDGVIYHICDRPFKANQTVTGRVNWTRRFDHMQQHSGEHIISGILCDTFQCDNVGFHLGSRTVTIDYNAPITWKQALAAERKANQIIWEDRDVEITWPSKEELAVLPYRSKKAIERNVRIVTFPEADRCACCGTHVKRAGQVGLVKILSCQKFHEGVRLELLCGKRAFDYLAASYEQDKGIGQLLSVKPEETLMAVRKLKSDMSDMQSRVAAMEENVFSFIARTRNGKGDVLIFQDSMRPESARRLADAVAHECGGLAAVFSEQEAKPEPGAFWQSQSQEDSENQKSDYIYALVRADGGEIPVKELNQALSGRGGGRNGFAQGGVHANRDEIELFFKQRYENIEIN